MATQTSAARIATTDPAADVLMEVAAPSRARARFAVSTIFFINGLVLASWVPHIPAVKQQHAISDGRLGLVLLFMAVGAVLALPVAGRLIDRFGSRAMTSIAATLFCLVLPLPVLSPNLVLLCVSLMLLGACNGTLDVSMNAQAVAVERRYKRAIMSSFHGLFSIGGVAGAALAGIEMSAGVGDAQHMITTAIATVLVVAIMLQWLVPSPAQPGRRGPVFVRPTGVLVGLGLLAFCGLLAEGSMGDWSAVYLHDVLRASPALAAVGFTAFSFAMAAGRFGGDYIVNLFGPGRVLRVSSALAACGLAVALIIGTPIVGIIGCGMVGLGIANIIPVLFSGAGTVPGVEEGTALAAVATTGYFGFLAGPPLIGLVAEVSSLPIALGVVSAACGLIALYGGVVSRIARQ